MKGTVPRLMSCGNVTRKAVRAIFLYRINSDRVRIPGHVKLAVLLHAMKALGGGGEGGTVPTHSRPQH
jgi:hypothetical protein